MPQSCHELGSDRSAASGDTLQEMQSQLDILERSMMRRLEVLDGKLDGISAHLTGQRAAVAPAVAVASEQQVDLPAAPRSPERRATHRRAAFAKRARQSASWIVGDVLVDKAAGKIWRFLEAPDSSRGAAVYYTAMSSAIFLCTVTSLFQARRSDLLGTRLALALDIVFNAMFVGELVVRFAISPTSCMFFRSPFNALDFVAILAGIARLVIGIVARDTYFPTEATVFIIMLPALQFMKLIRRFQLFHLLERAFREAIEALPFLIYVLLLIVLIFGAAIDLVEPDSNIANMDQAMWYVLVTISTVGYGDFTAKSAAGRCLTCVLIVIGTLYYAVPLGIVGNAFSHVWETRHISLLQNKMSCLLTLSAYTEMDLPLVINLFDTRGVGSVDLTDFRKMLIELNMHISPSDSLALFRAIDENGEGGISARVFVRQVFPKAYEGIYGRMQSSGEGLV